MIKPASLARTVAIALTFAVVLLQGCTNTVKYDDKPASKTVENDSSKDELTQITAKLLDHMLADSQLKAATRGKRPMMAVFGVINFSADDVDLAGINGQIYNQLNDSQRFRFTNANALAKQSAELNLNLHDFAEDPKTTQLLAKPVGADYLLVGEIRNIIRTQPKVKLVFYRISLRLLDTKSGQFIWEKQEEMLRSQKKIVYGV